MTNVSSTIDAALTMVMGDDMVKVRGSKGAANYQP